MAVPIIQCPHCKEYISADAKSCRFCSALVDPATVQAAIATQAAENRSYRRKNHGKTMLIGVGLFVLGLAITVGTYALASMQEGGGHYFVTYGLMLVGALNFFRGFVGWLGELGKK